MNFIAFFQEYKYYFLLAALTQHLFIGIFLTDLVFYARVIWPLNMLVLGLTSIGLFIGKNKLRIYTKIFLFIIVLTLPIILPFFQQSSFFLQLLSVIYIIYFLTVFAEVISFLIRPHYINVDIILAAACGYLLLIEINTFLLFFLYYFDNESLLHIDTTNVASIFMDLVYFSSIVKTTIGFGDISPQSYQAKLITSFFGIVSQFYTVVLIGILISKFTAQNSSNAKS